MPNLNSQPKNSHEFFIKYLHHHFHFKVNFLIIITTTQFKSIFISFIIPINLPPFIIYFPLFSKSKKVIKILAIHIFYITFKVFHFPFVVLQFFNK